MRRWNPEKARWEEVRTTVKTSKDGKQYATVEVVEVDGMDVTNLSPIDQIMTQFATKVNSHPDMNVRMLWQVTRNKRDDTFGEITFQGKNDPDYWLGVSYTAYTKSVIDRNEFTDILLALQGAGAKSTYFKEIVQKLGRGEI